ncbi:hypothetical protein GIB67_009763 [Kingdonia uniflora]|uniref:Uncharacterized protein n=1 Tax=Kingdonia uniflora TaxID=39325 RepID=A0A7J7LB71_9MAGN|nr:hypothetical protein GIB67_009763 [Kingdonia uniflora]
MTGTAAGKRPNENSDEKGVGQISRQAIGRLSNWKTQQHGSSANLSGFHPNLDADQAGNPFPRRQYQALCRYEPPKPNRFQLPTPEVVHAATPQRVDGMQSGEPQKSGEKLPHSLTGFEEVAAGFRELQQVNQTTSYHNLNNQFERDPLDRLSGRKGNSKEVDHTSLQHRPHSCELDLDLNCFFKPMNKTPKQICQPGPVFSKPIRVRQKTHTPRVLNFELKKRVLNFEEAGLDTPSQPIQLYIDLTASPPLPVHKAGPSQSSSKPVVTKAGISQAGLPLSNQLSLVRPRQQLTLITTTLPSSSSEEEQEPWRNGYATVDSTGWGTPETADFFRIESSRDTPSTSSKGKGVLKRSRDSEESWDCYGDCAGPAKGDREAVHPKGASGAQP